MLQDRDLKQLLHIKQDVAKHKWSQHISKQSRLSWKSIAYNVHVELVWVFTCGSIKQSNARQPQVTRELSVKKIELISNVSGPDLTNDSSQNPCYKPNVFNSGAFDTMSTSKFLQVNFHSNLCTFAFFIYLLNHHADDEESIVGVRVNAPFLWVGSHALPLWTQL